MEHYDKKQYRHTTYKLIGAYTLLFISLVGAGSVAYYGLHRNQAHHTIQHVAKVQQTVKLPSRLTKNSSPAQSRFIKISIPNSIRGTYISSAPLKQDGVNQYYKVSTIVSFTKHDIYEQCLLLPRRPLQFRVKSASNTSSQKKQWSKYKNQLSNEIPSNISKLVNHEKLLTRISNFNYDGQPGNLTQNGNMLHLQTRLQTMIGSQNVKKEYRQLKTVIPSNGLLPIKPSFQNNLNVLVDSTNFDLQINGRVFKKISLKQASKLCNQSNVHPYYIGINNIPK